MLISKFNPFFSYVFSISLLVYNVGAELPPNLPGEEITDDVLKWKFPEDTTRKKATAKPSTTEWYDKAAKTWEAPLLSDQMSRDTSTVPMGKGGIFIPRLTELHREPDIEIIDSTGKTITSGETGKTFSVEPGKYFVIIGSGAHRQRIVKSVEVQEFKTVPVLPDWCGLIVETVDTNTNAFRGEYELVRLEDFDPYGRGFGANVSMGEAVKTWILKPGTYKILGRGESFNTMKNFVTVRLLPGELVRFILIQRPDDQVIIGGGTVDISAGTKIASHWKYGANIGGNIQFIDEINNVEDKTDDIASLLSLFSSIWLRYINSPIEWETKLSLDEGVNLAYKSSLILTSGASDAFKARSLFIWRFLRWIGPYGSTEVNTNILPKNLSRDKKTYFLSLKDNGSSISTQKSTDPTFRQYPSFCPLTIDMGGGVNIDALNLNFLNITIRFGAGGSYSNYPEKYKVITSGKAITEYGIDSVLANNSIILKYEKTTNLLNLGPQASLSGNVRIGRFGTASAEVKILAPLYPEERFKNPDFDLNSILSWRIARSATLDYEFNYQLKQPEQVDARINKTTHKLLLRFSYSSR